MLDRSRGRGLAPRRGSPARPAPEKPIRKRAAIRPSIERARVQSHAAAAKPKHPASNGRRLPTRSAIGPQTSWPRARPARNRDSVSGTVPAGADRSRSILGKAGRYMSIASGEKAASEPRRITRRVESRGPVAPVPGEVVSTTDGTATASAAPSNSRAIILSSAIGFVSRDGRSPVRNPSRSPGPIRPDPMTGMHTPFRRKPYRQLGGPTGGSTCHFPEYDPDVSYSSGLRKERRPKYDRTSALFMKGRGRPRDRGRTSRRRRLPPRSTRGAGEIPRPA